MSVQISYELAGTGWAECVIRINDATATVTASYLSDALDDLASAVAAWPLCEDFRTQSPLLRRSQASTAGFSSRFQKGPSSFKYLSSHKADVQMRKEKRSLRPLPIAHAGRCVIVRVAEA